MMTETLAQLHNHKFASGGGGGGSPRLGGGRRSQQQRGGDRGGGGGGVGGERTRCHSDGAFLKVSSAVNMLNVHQVHQLQQQIRRGGSFVVGQKLRESKWFAETEAAIFCAVVETGFVVEQRPGEPEGRRRELGDPDPDQEQEQELERERAREREGKDSQYGIAVWKPGYEKSKNPDYLTIYTLTEQKGKPKVTALSVKEFWPSGTKLRINNKSDRTEKPLEETVIRNQISASQNNKKKWHNSEHFTYFCRYGPVESTHFRVKSITDHLKINTDAFFMRFRNKSTKQ